MEMRHRKWILALLVFLGALSVTGCVTRHDLRPDSQYPSDYSVGAVYLTKEVLFARIVNRTVFFVFQRLVLLTFERPTLTSVTDLQPGGRWEKFSKYYVLVPKGTLIRFERFTLEHNIAGNFVMVRGHILEGPFANHEVDLREISLREGRRTSLGELYMVDSRYLERVR